MREIIEIKLENLGIDPREFKRLEDDDLLEFFLNTFNLIRRVVINACHGGFGLSDAANSRYKLLAGITDPDWYFTDIERDDPMLVQVIEEYGPLANDRCSELRIVEIPADVQWEIAEYDGYEHIAEKHRTWR